MALEAWVLDGIPLTSGSFLMMSLTADPPKAKPEWISGADSEWAALLADPLHENREFTMKLRIPTAANMDAALDLIASIRDKLVRAARSRDGIQLVWTPHNSARSRTFDVLYGEIVELPIDKEGEGGEWFRAHPIFTLALTAKPYWYDTAETLTSTTTAATPLITHTMAGVGGDIPALGRLIVTDAAGQSRRYVEWGLEGPTYNAATSLLLDSDSLVTTGTAGAQTTATGAYDPNASGNNVIQATVGPSMTALASTGSLAHTGTFRVRARLWYNGTAVTTAQAAFQWGTTEGQTFLNPVVSFPGGSWQDVDLGTVTIASVLAGTQGWTGTLLVALPGTITYQPVIVDYVLLIPATAGYGRVRGTFSDTIGAVVQADPFTSITVGGALHARTAPLGSGTWVTSGVAGNDFAGDKLASPSNGIGQQIVRASTSDASARYAILGSTNYTNVRVAVLAAPWWEANDSVGVIARWTDSSNYLVARWISPTFVIWQVVAGSTTQLAVRTVNLVTVPAARVWRTINLYVYDTGRVVAQLFNGGFPSSDQDLVTAGAAPTLLASLEGQSSSLATGGTLATGKPGIYDIKTGAGNSGHWYDDFTVSIPPAENVALYPSGRTLEIRHDDVIRQDSTGTYYGRPTYRGTRFLVPPGASRLAVKARRNDVETAPDATVTDSTGVQVGYRTRGLVVPRT